jgi:hypothetical protein
MRAPLAALLTALLVAGCRGDGTVLSFLPACPGGETALFTTAPIAEAELAGLGPLGGLGPPGQTFPSTEIRFHVRDTAPVVSPGAVTIWQVERIEARAAGAVQTEHVVRFAPCANVSAYFTHVAALDPALAPRLGPFDDASCASTETVRTCIKTVRLDLPAGAPIGTADGATGLDFGLGDNRRPPLPYLDKRRDDFDPLHAACPVDYFEAAARAALEARFSDATGTVARTAAPLCGEIAQDLAGTAQGRWFVPDTAHSTPQAPHLALVHDNVDPTVPVFSVGTSLPAFAGTWTFVPQASGTIDRDFGDVRPGTLHCWNVTAWPPRADAPAWMVVAGMPDAFRLQIAARSAARCEDDPPTLDGAIEFER